MKLGARRSLFTELFCTKLIPKAVENGYEPRIDEAKRARSVAILYGYTSAECDRLVTLISLEFPDLAAEVWRIRDVKGISASVHTEGLAVDVVLAKNGVVVWDEAPFIELGEFWETLHPLCRAGFRFGDPGHFSVTPDGVRK
ncbi:MAG: hypothetical protein ACRDKE_07715 [Solirubrobacterales bacterium]